MPWGRPTGKRSAVRSVVGEVTQTRKRYGMALLAYAFAAVMLGTTLPTPMYALYADEMHFSVLTTTVIYATYAGGVLAALLLFGRWSDAIGRRPVLLAGAGFALASAVVFLFAASVPTLLVGYQGKSIAMTVQVKHRYDWPVVQDAASALQHLGIFYSSRKLAEQR